MHRQQLIVNIVDMEWSMFTTAQSVDGRADCQDDLKTFIIMRSSQFSAWSTDTLESYHADLLNALAVGANLMAVKYAYMMVFTYPEEYELIRELLPPVDSEVEPIAMQIAAAHAMWARELYERYPILSKRCRPPDYNTALDTGVERWAAQDNYLYSELKTYSVKTLRLCLRDVETAKRDGVNLAIEILSATITRYGFESLDDAEKRLAAIS